MLGVVNACEKSLRTLGGNRSDLYGLTLPLPIRAAGKQNVRRAGRKNPTVVWSRARFPTRGREKQGGELEG